MIPASATLILPVAAAIMAQSFNADYAAEQQRARDDAAANAHTLKVADEKHKAQERAARAAERKSPAPAPAGSPKDIARSLVSASQWGCFDSIITHESGWNVQAENPVSHSYGLAQALPPSKYEKYGPDWRTNPVPQLKFAVAYMDQRYGSPCAAWSFWKIHHWY